MAVLVAAIVLAAGGFSSGHAHKRPRAARQEAHTFGLALAQSSARARADEASSQAVDRVLAYTPYVSAGTPRRRDVALTFDDGPGPYTPRILQVLRRTHTPATFFVIGEWAKLYPQYVREETEAGAEVGDHTETHPFMVELSATKQQAEIVQAAEAIHAAGAPFPDLWRPPYGSFDATTLAILHELRMLVVLWTVDTSDYSRPGVPKIIFTALSGAKPGAIILMHDGGGDRSETVAALPRIIARLRARGYKLVTVSQLVEDDPPPRGQPPPVSLSGTG